MRLYSLGQFPIRTRPKEGEVFSSWLFRAASSLGLSVMQFCDLLIGRSSLEQIDRQSESSLLVGLLALRTGTEQEHATATLFRSCRGLCSDPAENGMYKHPWPWVLRSPRAHHSGAQRCTACLREDPYIRLEWCIALVTCCERHRVVLFDCCPRCTVRIEEVSYAFGLPARDYSQVCATCRNCGSTYSRYRMAEMPESASWLQSTCRPLFRAEGASAHFAALRRLLELITRGVDRFGYAVKLLAGLQISGKRNCKSRPFESLTASERLEALSVAAWMLQAWPRHFVAVMKLARFAPFCTPGRVFGFPWWRGLPLWYQEGLRCAHGKGDADVAHEAFLSGENCPEWAPVARRLYTGPQQ